MSRIAVQTSGKITRFGAFATGMIATAILAPQPLAAQDDSAITQPGESARAAPPQAEEAEEEQVSGFPDREYIDLTVTVPRNESDQLLEQDCEREADAGRIAGEIVVCRQLGEASDGSWNDEDWKRRYAARTQGAQPVDVAGEGIFRGDPTVGGLCLIPPCPAEAAIMIDVEALPEAPEGSDADRIARGLPPLGRDEELSPEEIAERRRALGLEAPPIPEE